MQFGTLLRELIGVSGVNQADLASALSFSTSELSKYVGGSRLPSARNIRGLMGRSALLFSEKIWAQGLTAQLRSIFPLMHLPKSRAELTVFLRHALSLSYRESKIASQEWTEGLNTLNMVLSGWEEIYHHLLISLSFAIRAREDDLHIYFTLGFFLAFIRNSPLPFPTAGAGKVHVHVLLDEKSKQYQLNWEDLRLWLSHMETARKTVSFDAWTTQADLGTQSFCFLEGAFVVLLNGLVPSSPIGVRMEDTRFLMEFGLLNRHLINTPLSHNRDEALSMIQQDADSLLEMLSLCQGIYSFGNFGFLAKPHHLDSAQAPGELKAFLAQAAGILMRRPVPMLISIAAVDHFSSQSGTLMPLIGWLAFEKADQVNYMASFEQLMDNPAAVRIHLSQHEFPECFMLALEEGLLIYQPDEAGGAEQFMLLPRALCGQLFDALNHMVKNETLPLERRLWSSYIKALPSLSGSLGSYPASLWAPPVDSV